MYLREEIGTPQSLCYILGSRPNKFLQSFLVFKWIRMINWMAIYYCGLHSHTITTHVSETDATKKGLISNNSNLSCRAHHKKYSPRRKRGTMTCEPFVVTFPKIDTASCLNNWPRITHTEALTRKCVWHLINSIYRQFVSSSFSFGQSDRFKRQPPYTGDNVMNMYSE